MSTNKIYCYTQHIKMLNRKFKTETIDESILNGFRGFEAVYNFYLEIYRRKEINETVSAQA